LRGKLQLEWWDPHTGQIQPMAGSPAVEHGEPVTQFELKLPPLHCGFAVGRPLN
jgi:hypothetical protein